MYVYRYTDTDTDTDTDINIYIKICMCLPTYIYACDFTSRFFALLQLNTLRMAPFYHQLF